MAKDYIIKIVKSVKAGQLSPYEGDLLLILINVIGKWKHTFDKAGRRRYIGFSGFDFRSMTQIEA